MGSIGFRPLYKNGGNIVWEHFLWVDSTQVCWGTGSSTLLLSIPGLPPPPPSPSTHYIRHPKVKKKVFQTQWKGLTNQQFIFKWKFLVVWRSPCFRVVASSCCPARSAISVLGTSTSVGVNQWRQKPEKEREAQGRKRKISNILFLFFFLHYDVLSEVFFFLRCRWVTKVHF